MGLLQSKASHPVSSAANSQDAAWGALLGLAVGDAAGATLEFLPSQPDKKVWAAMRMQGTDYYGTGPAQVTDDTELAMCLAEGLVSGPPPEVPLEAVARRYAHWHQNHAINEGVTCGLAFEAGAHALLEDEAAPVAQRMAAAAAASGGSRRSKANGALMRVAPLAIWGRELPPDELARCAVQEAGLTHPNPTCLAANAAYCIMLAHLIQHPGDSHGAIQAARDWLAKGECSADSGDFEKGSGSAEVSGWVREALALGSGAANPRAIGLPMTSKIGFVRWGFLLACAHLSAGSSFEDAMFSTLRHGGDTDTNAAIVGGLTGALHGESGIPGYMKAPVLARGPGSPGIPRPDHLAPARLPHFFQQLWECSSRGDGSNAHNDEPSE